MGEVLAQAKRLNPGSEAAIAAGCRCPVLDNAYGKGARYNGKDYDFWISGDCPLHGAGTPSPEAPSDG